MTDLQLWDYQKQDAAQIASQYGTINGSKPGTGKTAVALTAAALSNAKTVLIICPKLAFGVWEQEALKWKDWDSTIYTGTPKQRTDCWKAYLKKTSYPRILITNIAQAKEVQDRQVKWDFIIADEVHSIGLLNHKNQAFKVMCKFKCQHILPMTGTPIRRDPSDLWTLLHLCDPDKFTTYWGFVNRYCIVMKDYFGQHIEGRPKDVRGFNQMLHPYFIRRSVDDKLPGKYRQCIDIDLEGEHKVMYDQLQQEMILEAGDQLTVTPNVMTQVLRLRQLLIAPQMFGAKQQGVILDTLCDMLVDQFLNGSAVTICTPFKVCIPYIEDAIYDRMNKEHLAISVYKIHGGIKEKANDVAMQFQADKNLHKVLIYTIKSGTAFTAHTANTCFFVGYEWSAIDNLQAEDRIYRLGQLKPVMIYYLLAKGTVDQAVMDKLDSKQTAANWVLTPGEMLASYHKAQEEAQGRL